MLSAENNAEERSTRLGKRTAVVGMMERMLDPKRDPDRPSVVVDDLVINLVPLRSIRSVRVIDPELAPDTKLGFATDFG